MKKPKPAICGQCRNYTQLNETEGYCHRFPPTPVYTGRGVESEPLFVSVFPQIAAERAACGEFKGK